MLQFGCLVDYIITIRLGWQESCHDLRQDYSFVCLALATLKALCHDISGDCY